MLKIELDFQDLYSVIKKLREADDSDFLLEVSENCPFLENLLAFKIIKSEARNLGRKVVFAAKSSDAASLVETLNTDAESFGFVRGFDVGSAPPFEKVLTTTRINVPLSLLSFLKSKLSLGKDLGFIVAVVAGLLLFAFYLLFYYLPKATITLTVEAESLVESIDVIASPSAQRIDSIARVIPAALISSTSKKSASATSSGTKEVGDKASGEVTVYNKTGSTRTFPAKTVLTKGRTQGNDLNYLLSNDVVVPAQISGISGVATTSAVAEKIGDEYNIPANNTLTVSGNSTSSFISENTKTFGGGSRRSITVVTDDDQKKLLSSVKNELEAELTSQLRTKLVSDQKMDEGSLNFTITSKTYDKNVAEETSSFNLVLEEKASVLVYSESDIKGLLSEALKGYVPENYELFGEDRSVEVVSAKYDNGNLFFTTKVKGFIVPRLDEKKIKEGIAGLSLPSARKYLGGLSSITSFQIDNFLNLPGFSFLPRNKDSIKIVIVRQ